MSIRQTDAYAKQGRERYPSSSSLAEEFQACLLEADSGSSVLVVRAARLFLDICFFHPFDDGNARLAWLALDFLFTKAGLCLRDVSAFFTMPHSAHDEVVAEAFIAALQENLSPIGATH